MEIYFLLERTYIVAFQYVKTNNTNHWYSGEMADMIQRIGVGGLSVEEFFSLHLIIVIVI